MQDLMYVSISKAMRMGKCSHENWYFDDGTVFVHWRRLCLRDVYPRYQTLRTGCCASTFPSLLPAGLAAVLSIIVLGERIRLRNGAAVRKPTMR